MINLADLFRYVLAASRDVHATLADKLEVARLYLSVEAIRFGDRLTVDIDVPDALDPCTIRAAARREADTLRLCVTDTGPGLDPTDPAVVLARGTGLANVRERLLHFFDGAASLRLPPRVSNFARPSGQPPRCQPRPTL